MTKKLTIFTFAFLLNVGFAEAATRFYFGLDAQGQMLNIETKKSIEASDGSGKVALDEEDYYPQGSVMPSPFIGLDVADMLKFEFSYAEGTASKKNQKETGLYYVDESNPAYLHSRIRTKTLSFDIKPYKKFDKISLYGIIGASYYKISIRERYYIGGSYDNLLLIDESQTNNKIAPNLGFGVEYELLQSLFARIQVKSSFINMPFNNFTYGVSKVSTVTNVNVGVGYYF
jgi:opacity protein-like surface antigen